MLNFKNNKFPLVLMILDGWGLSKETTGNAIALAKTPNINNYFKKYSSTTINASAEFVGLPKAQPGNSEAGHMNIGAGRLVEQDDVIISKSINNGTFFKNPALLQVAKHVKANNSDIHLMGLICDVTSPHSDMDHLLSLLSFFVNKTKQKIYLHLFTDGRDSPRFAALKILNHYEKVFASPRVQVATVMGRFYAMDRKKAWDRTQMAFDAMTMGHGQTAKNAEDAVSQAYNRGESDEFILPTVIVDEQNKPVSVIGDDDAVVFFNLRSDRARQLSKVFVQPNFEKKNPDSFIRANSIKNLLFVALTDFGPDLDSILTAFPSMDLQGTLVSAMSDYRQLYIAESEKYAHVTYFFNGGYDRAIVGEKRVNIPSQVVPTYDLKPAMSAREITKYVVKALNKKQYDFIVLNFANLDMIGHTGNLQAAIKAVEVVDECLGSIMKTLLKKKGTAVITADHGNIEDMINLKTGEVETEHSCNKVPFIVINDQEKYKLKDNGSLCNVAPTILDILEINKPVEMTADSLIIK
ncbi:MAG: 2,3-bisphosphoglycerate-independent phosphoglycerate mutase [Patescibacteria group bacterium]|nr:2,3-bisphosphoglycerate-independent phosphoglycerate mutase [Patescibacteria group bacterium]